MVGEEKKEKKWKISIKPFCALGCVLRGHQCRYTWYEATLIVSRTQTRTNSDTFFFFSSPSFLCFPLPQLHDYTPPLKMPSTFVLAFLCCAAIEKMLFMCKCICLASAEKEFNFCPFILRLSTDPISIEFVAAADFHSIKTNYEQQRRVNIDSHISHVVQLFASL